jgi:hypothetical protein
MALAALKIWNRYFTTTTGTKGAVDGLTTSFAGPVDGLASLIGDCGVGAVTFNVEPSEDGALVPSAGAVGVRGVLDFDVHATVRPRSTATPVAKRFRGIKGLQKTRNVNRGDWCVS